MGRTYTLLPWLDVGWHACLARMADAFLYRLSRVMVRGVFRQWHADRHFPFSQTGLPADISCGRGSALFCMAFADRCLAVDIYMRVLPLARLGLMLTGHGGARFAVVLERQDGGGTPRARRHICSTSIQHPTALSIYHSIINGTETN